MGDESGDEIEVKPATQQEPNGNVQIKLEKSSKNPWISFYPVLNSVTSESETNKAEESIEVYKKPEAYINREELERAQNEIDAESSEDDSIVADVEFIRSTTKSKIEDTSSDEAEKPKSTIKPRSKKQKKIKMKEVEVDEISPEVVEPEVVAPKTTEIDPKNILLLNEAEQADDICATVSNTNNNDSLLVSTNKSEIQRLTISEAFADDDVVEEFKSEKVGFFSCF